MMKLLSLFLAVALTIGFMLEGRSQQPMLPKVLRPLAANFREAPGQVLFSPSGKLYVAYRVSEKGGTSSVLRVVIFDPISGQQTTTRDYPVQTALLPRVATAFVLSQDGSTLAYAELHAPQVVLTIEAATLKPLSISDAITFGERDSGPRVSSVNSHSLVLSSDRLGRNGRATTTERVRKLSLSVADLHEVVSDETIQPDADTDSLRYWTDRIRPKRDLSGFVPLDDHVLGLTNVMTEGSIQLFDQAGKELATLHNPDCGFARASLSPDQRVGVAVCERTGLDESHFGETLRRDAVVFEAKTLKAIATIPMSRLSVKEHGPERGDLWVAFPSPAVWHGNNGVLVALPDFPDSIDLYSISTHPKAPALPRQ